MSQASTSLEWAPIQALFTFNQVAEAEAWRRAQVERLAAAAVGR